MTVVFWQPATASTADPRFKLIDAYVEFKTGSLYKQYAKQNPREAQAIDTYWGGGAKPAAMTATGRALVMWADVYRSI